MMDTKQKGEVMHKTTQKMMQSALGNMTQLEAARLLEVSQPAIHKWLAGKSAPSHKATLKIEKCLGIPRHVIRPDIYPPPTPPTEDQS